MANEIFLDIELVLNTLQATPSCRNFKEGQALLNARHLILCGASSKSDTEIRIFALCLQTSGINNEPHEITGQINLGPTLSVCNLICSCKAGTGAKCKHISATLLYCTRNDVMQFEVLSSTDKKCFWKNKKTSALNQYLPMPLLDTDCFKQLKIKAKKSSTFCGINNEEVLSTFLQACPNSALAKHRLGRLGRSVNIAPTEGINIVEHEEEMAHVETAAAMKILSKLLSDENLWMDYTEGLNVAPLHECCKDVYAGSIVCDDPLKLCLETKDNLNMWSNERKFRITGSRCYGLYTYGKGNQRKVNWQEKSRKYFAPKPFNRTAAMEHGVKFEKIARDEYKLKKNVDVIETGLIVSQKNPWLGYSPDGIVIENDVPTKLLEIKCVDKGRTITISEAIKTVKYVTTENNNYGLKRKHMYYGQIQLGMALLNLTITDFVIFASLDHTFIVISVPLDHAFVKDLLFTLKVNYFTRMLHHLCLR